MANDTIVGLAFIAPILVLAGIVIVRDIIRGVDRRGHDHVAEYKRRISHRGFKSRMGAREHR